ncbi:uncharacterized protein LOC108915986 [Anoplophora glabripennis]|uniref:uncharacterized protein LOC108915986 n=1 Tax=Anoplophora glabripennis TaxID=217634 RepID=UPI0008740937|nr:uncharacterized protein LOC108915986 [Anoplophora glabripennis]
MCYNTASLVLLLIISYNAVSAQNVSDILKSVVVFRGCLKHKHSVVCMKEKALEILNETIMNDNPMHIGFLEIQRNPDFFINSTENEVLPREASERSSRLSDIILNKIEQFFKSRTVKLNLSDAFEGRKGGGGGGGGGGKGGKGGAMAMMAIAGMGAMMANMMMGKMALMSGSALMIAKISLILSIIMIVKKMQGSGGGGGEEKHIVYATSSDSGHSHGGGGGWHRSLEDAQNIVYRGQWGPSSSENGSGL